jgi:hypothetical protein
VLFAFAGASAGGVVDPSVSRIKQMVDAAADGPVTAELRAALAGRRLTTFTWLMGGADLAIVFMMTNKPGWTGSLVAAAIGLALGAAFALRENRHAVTAVPAAPAATA